MMKGSCHWGDVKFEEDAVIEGPVLAKKIQAARVQRRLDVEAFAHRLTDAGGEHHRRQRHVQKAT